MADLDNVREIPQRKAIVVGAGFSGLATGCMLKQNLKCTDFVIYERDQFYGGTWYANQYPGCGVDIPSIFYSLSFAPNPDFTKLFPEQPEILEYIRNTAQKFGVDKHIQLNTEWIDAKWSDKTKTWRCTFRSRRTGDVFAQQCKVLISGTGGLVEPNKVQIKGVEDFKGEVLHSAKWDHKVSLEDKNVCIIGNGCSATQIIPAIQPKVKTLHQFMRTPQYYFPRYNPEISGFLKWCFRYIPGLMKAFRYGLFVYIETTFNQFRLTASGARDRQSSRNECLNFIRKKAPEKYWPLLTPTYAVGCKRRIFDPGYIQSLHSENLTMTDDPIDHFKERSVVTASGKEYDCDVFIAANGFAPMHFEMPVHGRNGSTMQAHWSEMGGIEAYKSVAMSDFPNFFLIFGPNAATGHTSAVYSIENAVDLCLRMVEPILREDSEAEAVEVKKGAEVEWTRKLQEALRQRVWADNCKGWYVDKNGWNFTTYPYSQWHLWFVSRFPFKGDWNYDRTEEQERRRHGRVTRRNALVAGTALAAVFGLSQLRAR